MEIDNQLGQQLHDRATRGQTLTVEEQAQLQAWYDFHDQAEAELLRANWKPRFDSAAIERGILEQLDQIAVVTEKIRVLEIENAQLRQELSELRRNLAQRRSAQVA